MLTVLMVCSEQMSENLVKGSLEDQPQNTDVTRKWDDHSDGIITLKSGTTLPFGLLLAVVPVLITGTRLLKHI